MDNKHLKRCRNIKATFLLLLCLVLPATNAMDVKKKKQGSIRPPSSSGFLAPAEEGEILDTSPPARSESSTVRFNLSPSTPAEFSGISEEQIVFTFPPAETSVPEQPVPDGSKQSKLFRSAALSHISLGSRLSTHSRATPSPNFKRNFQTSLLKRRRTALHPGSSGIADLDGLPPDEKDVFNILISHKEPQVVKDIFELMKQEDFHDALTVFTSLSREHRRAHVYVPHHDLISKEFKTISSKAAREMDLQIDFVEALHEVHSNGRTLYWYPLLVNGALYAANAGAVIFAQAYLPSLTLLGARAVGVEDNLPAVCSLVIRGDTFELGVRLAGGFFERLSLSPIGWASNLMLGTAVAVAPPVIKTLIMPVFMWPYKHLVAACLDTKRSFRSRARSREALKRIVNLGRVGVTDQQIQDLLQNEHARKSLQLIASNRERGLKFTEIVARLPAETEGAEVDQRRVDMFNMLDNIGKCHKKNNRRTLKKKSGCGACFVGYFNIDLDSEEDPADAGLIKAVYRCFYLRECEYGAAVVTNVITDTLLVIVVMGVGGLVPYVSASDSAEGTFGPPSLNGTCQRWLVEGFPNETFFESDLRDLNPGPTPLFLTTSMTFATGLGLPAVRGGIHQGVKKIVGLIGYAFCCCRKRKRKIEDDIEMEPAAETINDEIGEVTEELTRMHLEGQSPDTIAIELEQGNGDSASTDGGAARDIDNLTLQVEKLRLRKLINES